MSFELIIGILTLFGSAALGLPVAFAILVGVLVYLGVAGQDLAIAGETMVQRLFDGFLLLAVPLFIVSANIMKCRINFRQIAEFLCRACWPVSWRFRPCQCCDKPDLFGNVWLGRC